MLACGGLSGLPMTGAAAGPELSRAAVSEGVGGVVNELLVQMQSFDAPTGWQRVQALAIDAVNAFLPADRVLPRPRPEPAEVLLIAATNEPRLTLEEVRAAIQVRGLNNLAVPREIKLVHELPRLGTGKINHRELEKMV